MTVRKATMSDATRLAELSEALGYPVEPEVVKGRIERLLSRPENVLLVADLAESGVAGWIHAAEQDILEAGRSFEILGLVVASNQRNHGIGRRLVERVEQWAVERGLTREALEQDRSDGEHIRRRPRTLGVPHLLRRHVTSGPVECSGRGVDGALGPPVRDEVLREPEIGEATNETGTKGGR